LQDRMQQEGKTAVLVSADDKVIGAIGLLDMAKQGAKEAVAPLKSLGIEPVMVTGDNIRDVVSAIETSKKIVGKIRQNLVYAFMYNVVLIPVAAMGLLYPALAGLAMAASSVSVTASSLALRQWNPRKSQEFSVA
jgi:cation transport ATPase